MDEIDAIAFLLERGYGLDQYDILMTYRSDVYNEVNGISHPFLVNWGTYPDDTEKAFQTAREAAKYFVEKRKELQL